MVEFLRAGLSAACGTVSWPCFIEYRRGILRKKLVKFGKLMRDRKVLSKHFLPTPNSGRSIPRPKIFHNVMAMFYRIRALAECRLILKAIFIGAVMPFGDQRVAAISTPRPWIGSWRCSSTALTNDYLSRAEGIEIGFVYLCGHTTHEECIIAMRRCLMCHCAVRMFLVALSMYYQ